MPPVTRRRDLIEVPSPGRGVAVGIDDAPGTGRVSDEHGSPAARGPIAMRRLVFPPRFGKAQSAGTQRARWTDCPALLGSVTADPSGDGGPLLPVPLRSLHMTVPVAHLIFKTHLDIGFTDLAERVRAQYHRQFIPQASRPESTSMPRTRMSPAFVWTTGAWLIWDHLKTGTREQSTPAGTRHRARTHHLARAPLHDAYRTHVAGTFPRGAVLRAGARHAVRTPHTIGGQNDGRAGPYSRDGAAPRGGGGAVPPPRRQYGEPGAGRAPGLPLARP